MNLIIRLLNAFRILRYLNLEGSVRLNGRLFKIPVLGGTGYANLDMSEPWMMELLSRLVPLGRQRFIDVGVNIGQTLLKLRAISPDIDYLGIEPNPACIHYVNRLIKTNGINGVRLLPVGISNRSGIGELNFYSDLEEDSMASVVGAFRGTSQTTRKEFIPLIDWAGIRTIISDQEISIIKIDVEGGEWEVLDGLTTELTRQRPFILMEILPAYSTENVLRVERQLQIQKRLHELGYRIYLIIKSNHQLIGVQVMPEVPIHGDENRCEYVMVPVNRVTEFETAVMRHAG